MKVELVTSLKRHATEIIAGLQKNQDPILITQHGRPAAYLVDVESYDEAMRRISVLEGIALGEKAIREGKIITHEAIKKKYAKWLIK